jgi:hypothetical protein
MMIAAALSSTAMMMILCASHASTPRCEDTAVSVYCHGRIHLSICPLCSVRDERQGGG